MKEKLKTLIHPKKHEKQEKKEQQEKQAAQLALSQFRHWIVAL
jgi:hypothetical protein